jgi:hypothetical protein
MKIERQIMEPKSTFTKSKLIMTDIDNEWNDFLMVRGCNWEPSASADDDGKNNKNSKNEKKNCDKKYKVYKKNDYANKGDDGGDEEEQQPTVQQPRLESNTDSDDDDDGVKTQSFKEEQLLRNGANNANEQEQEQEQVPVCSPIYISTKTKISYLNTEIDIKKVFWDIPVMPYSSQCKGIVKKQIKFSSITKEELAEIEERVQTEVEKKTGFVETQIIEHIDNPDGRIKFKDQRKINIGLCKKDILNCRCKKKRAFFNCFVLIVRVEDEMSPPGARTFKEMHIKVFNTGKIEVPGIQNDASLQNVIDILISILKNIIGEHVDYQRNKSETVLINSNFNCGYYIDRDKLYDILKYKYRINSNYDSCSYPGIQCKFFYCISQGGGGAEMAITNKQCGQHEQQQQQQQIIQTGQQPTPTPTTTTTSLDIDPEKYIEISFMVFRTGSVLIVGKCEDYVLHDIYGFIKELLRVEFSSVGSHIINHEDAVKKHIPKLRTRIIVNNI